MTQKCKLCRDNATVHQSLVHVELLNSLSTDVFSAVKIVKNTLVAVTPLDPIGELTALPRPEARPRLRVKGRKGRKKGGNKQSGEGREKVKRGREG